MHINFNTGTQKHFFNIEHIENVPEEPPHEMYKKGIKVCSRPLSELQPHYSR